MQHSPHLWTATLAAALAMACAEAPPERPAPADEPELREPTTQPAAPAAPDPEPTVAAPIGADRLAALEALGYAEASPTDNPAERGVAVHRPEAWAGVNLFSSRDRASALLIDMDGRELHRWSAGDDQPARRSWMHVEPLRDGSIYTITKDHSVALHAWDSSVTWRTRIGAHHDLAIRADGGLLVLTRGPETVAFGGVDVPVLADSIARLSARGEVESVTPLSPVLGSRYSQWRLGRARAQMGTVPQRQQLRPGGIADMLHTNSITILQRAIEGVAPAGSILISCRAISRVFVLDAALERVLYTWGAGELEGQHDATQLPSGNLLLFDNGSRRSASRVLEIDPRTNAIVWRYAPQGLYSMLRSGAQRLPNDNVLITESDRGHALEVTRAGEVVWEFWNPDVRGSGDDAQRAVIYRLNRYPPDFFQR